jgi:hypothetical protein
MLEHVSSRENSVRVEIHTDWERFQSLLSDLILPRIQIDAVEEAENVASAFTASIASACRLSTRKLTLSDLNSASSELSFLQFKRKLWHETRDPACKTALYWVTKTIRRMIRRKAIERWDTKIGNSEVTHHAMWPIAKSIMRMDRRKGPTAIHSPGLNLFLLEKANEIANCPENQFTPHDLCDEDHERQVVARVQSLTEAVDDNPSERVKPCDIQKLINSN